MWRDLRTTTQNLSGTTVNESLYRLDFGGGGSITIRSTHAPDLLRGAGLDFVVLDEAAYMPPNTWAEVVRPMLLDRQGGALFLSTPNGRNWFHDLYALGQDAEQADWASFQFPSSANPLIAASEFEAIHQTTPERIWRAEYLAEFVDDAGVVFRGLREAATLDAGSGPQEGHRYIMGCDWGREQDFTALVVIDATTRQMVAMDRFQHIGWHLQRERLKTLAAKWQTNVIWAEANSMGSVNIEALQRDGLPVRPFMTTSRSKAPLIESLSLAIERGDLSLIKDATLLNELSAYTLERLAGGGYRYSAPSGQHDDSVIALALAWYGVQMGGGRMSFA